MSFSHLSQLHYAFGKPTSAATIRQYPEDFQVTEQLSFELSGEGQHSYVFIEKRDLNTDDVAQQLARFADVSQLAVGYAGLKDRNAVTRQWFSIDLAGKDEPDWDSLNNNDKLKILETSRHSRKLKRGAIRNNHFRITLRDVKGDPDDINRRVKHIQEYGVPNYFGEQRFGRNDGNLKQAEKLFLPGDKPVRKKRIKRHLRSIYLSAVRAYLFNLVLSQRVADKTWNQPISGDVFMLDGSHSVFTVDVIDDEIIRRVNEFDIHATGPMWGSGVSMATGKALAMEIEVLTAQKTLCDLLERNGLRQDRRPLRLQADEFDSMWTGNEIVLSLSLPAGSYATSLLREIINNE